MTLQQFRDQTADLPGTHELVWHDCHCQTVEPAEVYTFEEIAVGDPMRLRLSPTQILISGSGDPLHSDASSAQA